MLIVVALVLFGSTQIPKLARSLGSAQKEFKKGLDEGSAEEGKDAKSLTEGTTAPAAMNPPAQAPSNVDGTAGSAT